MLLLTNILIVVFCISSLIGGAIVILSRNPMRSLLGLFLTAISAGILFLLFGGPFLAMVQLIVYAGAVLMLFLIVVRYFGHPSGTRKIQWQNPLAVAACFVMLFQFVIPLAPLLAKGLFENWESPPGTQEVGLTMFTKYIYPVELASVLLLVAIVGAIYMAREDRKKSDGDA